MNFALQPEPTLYTIIFDADLVCLAHRLVRVLSAVGGWEGLLDTHLGGVQVARFSI